MKILVTGGAGFIGSHFIKYLSNTKNRDKIVCIDKLTYAGDKRNLEGYFHNIIFYENSINDQMINTIFQLEQPDVIVNFAAETHVDNSIRNPKSFLETDIMGLFNLVYYSIKYKVKKFIHVSTDEVYGPVCREAFETDKLNPTSPYSASKASADLLLQSYFKTYNFPVVIVRPCNNYGPNQYIEKLIPLSIMRLLTNKKVVIHGQGREIREWIFVEDCVEAIYQVMVDGKIGEIYNIGSNDRKTNINVIDYILSILFKGEQGSLKEHVEFVNNRPGNDFRYAINSDKIESEICDTFLKTRFKEGIKKTVGWYILNNWRYKDLNLDLNIYEDNEDYLR